MTDEIKLTNLVREIGVPAHVKGYKYLQDAIELVLKRKIDSFTKVIYPAVAEMNNTTASRAERAIRHAIEISWNPHNEAIIKLFVNPPEKRPCVAQFVATIVDSMEKNMI